MSEIFFNKIKNENKLGKPTKCWKWNDVHKIFKNFLPCKISSLSESYPKNYLTIL